jgi:hypothetical protein
MARLLSVIILMAIVESAWALVAAEIGVPLLVFYGILVVASSVFWVPWVAREGGKPTQTKR